MKNFTKNFTLFLLLITNAILFAKGGNSVNILCPDLGDGTTYIHIPSDDSSLPIDISSIFQGTSSTTVSGVNGLIKDMNLSIDIDYNPTFEVQIGLTSPSGTRVALAYNLGTGSDFDCVVFDDEAGTTIATQNSPYSGTFVPQELLRKFDGEDPNGTWEIDILTAGFFSPVDKKNTDKISGTGTLNDWGLHFNLTDGVGKDFIVKPYEATICGIAGKTVELNLELTNINSSDSYTVSNSGVSQFGFSSNSIPALGGTLANASNEVFTASFDIPNGTAIGTVFNGEITVASVGGGTPQIIPIQIKVADPGDGGNYDFFTGQDVNLPFATPDFIENTSEIIISNVVGTVQDLNVVIEAEHQFASDLVISLISPNGTEVILSDANGDDADFECTVFDDEANTLVEDGESPMTGTFVPDEPLATFDNETINGTWQLKVLDDGITEIGRFLSWGIMVKSPAQEDLKIVELNPPENPKVNTTQDFSVKVTNIGALGNSADGKVHFILDNPVTHDSVSFSNLDLGDTLTVNFPITFGGIVESLTANSFVVLENGTDGDFTNDSLSTTFDLLPGCISTFPYTENFDNAVLFDEANFDASTGWVNLSGDDFDWESETLTTPSGSTGPSGDNTNGNTQYLYTEASGDNSPSKVAILQSPCFDISALANPQVSFFYHMFGSNMGSLKVDVLDGDNNVLLNDAVSLVGEQQNSSSDDWKQAFIAVGSLGSDEIIVRFEGTTGSSFRSDISIDDFSLIEQPEHEIELVSLILVNDFPSVAGTNFDIQIILKNNGVNTAQNVNFQFDIDGDVSNDTTLINVFTNVLANTFDTTTVTLVATENVGSITLEATAILTSATETLTNNNSQNLNYQTYANPICSNLVDTFPYNEDFDNVTNFNSTNFSTTGWENILGDDFDWEAKSTSTPSSGTGPFGDNTSGSGQFLYTEASDPNNPFKDAFLYSPCFDLEGLSSPTLGFFYHMFGVNMGTMSVDVMDTNGTVLQLNAIEFDGQQQSSNNADFLEAQIDLSQFVGEKVRFRWRALTEGFTSDMAIDDVSLIDNLNANDVGVTLINSGRYSVMSNCQNCEQVTVTVRNFGTNTNSFDVIATIPGKYSNTVSVTNLASGNTQEVTFPDIDLSTFNSNSSFTLTVSTNLVGDEDNSNDVLTYDFDVDTNLFGYDDGTKDAISVGLNKEDGIIANVFTFCDTVVLDSVLVFMNAPSNNTERFQITLWNGDTTDVIPTSLNQNVTEAMTYNQFIANGGVFDEWHKFPVPAPVLLLPNTRIFAGFSQLTKSVIGSFPIGADTSRTLAGELEDLTYAAPDSNGTSWANGNLGVSSIPMIRVTARNSIPVIAHTELTERQEPTLPITITASIQAFGNSPVVTIGNDAPTVWFRSAKTGGNFTPVQMTTSISANSVDKNTNQVSETSSIFPNSMTQRNFAKRNDFRTRAKSEILSNKYGNNQIFATFTAQIPVQAVDDSVEYYIAAKSGNGNVITAPFGGTGTNLVGKNPPNSFFSFDMKNVGNDICENATEIIDWVTPLEIDNREATADPNNLQSCGFSSATVNKSLWYKFTVPTGETWEVSFTTEDSVKEASTVLELFTGSCGSFTSIDCNDNENGSVFHSRLPQTGVLTLNPGEYHLLAGGFGSLSGEFVLRSFRKQILPPLTNGGNPIPNATNNFTANENGGNQNVMAIELTTNGGGTNPTQITVETEAGQNPTDLPNSVARTFNVATVGGNNFTANLTFFFLDSEAPEGLSHGSVAKIFRFDGVNWVEQGTAVVQDAGNGLCSVTISATQNSSAPSSKKHTSNLAEVAGDFGIASNDSPLFIELEEFSAKQIEDKVKLEWITSSEFENLGFEIHRSNEEEENFVKIASYESHEELEGKGSFANETNYTFTDNKVKIGETYFYKLVDVSFDLVKTQHETVKLITDIEKVPESKRVISKFALRQNYPNPFNPTTTISFEVPNIKTDFKWISLSIFNIKGQLVRTLKNGLIEGGIYKVKWDGTDNLGKKISSGVYFVRMKTNTEQFTRKMLLLK